MRKLFFAFLAAVSVTGCDRLSNAWTALTSDQSNKPQPQNSTTAKQTPSKPKCSKEVNCKSGHACIDGKCTALEAKNNLVRTKPLVAPLKNSNAISGCSWAASSEAIGPDTVFLGEHDDSKFLMNIDGSDVVLKLVHESGELGLGHTLYRTFRGGNAEVKAQFNVVRDCTNDEEMSCEVGEYNAKFDVSKGQQHQIFQAQGSVGC